LDTGGRSILSRACPQIRKQQLPQAIKAIVAGHDINYQGAWGPIDWDSRGDPTTAVYVIWKHEHGKITILRTITFRR
jgi:ABC-type branched-subunit amino acid transport system substrate-binding protein